MTKRELQNLITADLDKIEADFKNGKLSPLERYNKLQEIYNNRFRNSEYAAETFAQIWERASREHSRKTFGWCGLTQF